MSAATAEHEYPDKIDNTYVSGDTEGNIPVTRDDELVEDPIDPKTADTDEQLGMGETLLTLHCECIQAKGEQKKKSPR
jgi:hypothetical protein